MIKDQPGWINGIIEKVKPFTLTSEERIAALCNSVAYVVRWNIPGSIVECGVWKGGSMMAAALTLQHFDATDRDLYLFDTFAGMTAPSANDTRARDGVAASEIMANAAPDHGIFCFCPLEEVVQNVSSVGYPAHLVHYVKGDVAHTLPGSAPAQIALLRLDTDWYDSTKHELETCYPRLSAGGVLIVDDYGHWEGAGKATDEFVEAAASPILLNRIDYTGRLAVKVAA